MTKTVTINNQNFILHPSGAMLWKEKSTLLISDVHLGKVNHFRKHGIAVPGNSIFTNFEKLDTAVEYFSPKNIIFLGDLFHSKKNREWEIFENWKGNCRCNVVLVAGNHDVIAQKHYDNLKIEVVSEIEIEGLLMTHHPTERDDLFNIAGHIHPGIRLRGIGRQYLSLPCFFIKKNQMIMPAFGEFTGKFHLVPTSEDCVYAITKEEVLKIC